jgi:hypothetical protein
VSSLGDFSCLTIRLQRSDDGSMGFATQDDPRHRETILRNSGSLCMPLQPLPHPAPTDARVRNSRRVTPLALKSPSPFAATGTTLFPAGYRRNFSSFDDAPRECVEGRMLSGAHFRFSDEDALYLGQHISRYAIRNILAAR